MAGLQYYFFPTDFFYPRPSSANGDNTSMQQAGSSSPNSEGNAENIEKCKIVISLLQLLLLVQH